MSVGSKDRRLCVIIPTYNNVQTIGQVVKDVMSYCDQLIVVDDGCTDGTLDVLHSLSESIHIVSYQPNRGKGHALVAGFKKAKELGYTHAITIDADGQHFADDIPQLIVEMERCPQAIIVGCRNLTEKNMPRQNTFASSAAMYWPFRFAIFTASNCAGECWARARSNASTSSSRDIFSRLSPEVQC